MLSPSCRSERPAWNRERTTRVLNVQELMAILPHRYPFLLIDRIVEMEVGKRAVGEKQVTINEPFFQGHFPGYPVMPGVLLIEALAQTGAVAVLSLPEFRGKIALLVGVDNVRFRKPVQPGDTLRLTVTLDKIRHGLGKGSGVATVEGQTVCEGNLLFAIAASTTASHGSSDRSSVHIGNQTT